MSAPDVEVVGTCLSLKRHTIQDRSTRPNPLCSVIGGDNRFSLRNNRCLYGIVEALDLLVDHR